MQQEVARETRHVEGLCEFSGARMPPHRLHLSARTTADSGGRGSALEQASAPATDADQVRSIAMATPFHKWRSHVKSLLMWQSTVHVFIRHGTLNLSVAMVQLLNLITIKCFVNQTNPVPTLTKCQP